jgi:hypothetical protein
MCSGDGLRGRGHVGDGGEEIWKTTGSATLLHRRYPVAPIGRGGGASGRSLHASRSRSAVGRGVAHVAGRRSKDAGLLPVCV